MQSSDTQWKLFLIIPKSSAEYVVRYFRGLFWYYYLLTEGLFLDQFKIMYLYEKIGICTYKLYYNFFCFFCQKISNILLGLFGVTFIFSFLWWPYYIYFFFKIEWNSIKLFDGIITISVNIHMGMTSLCVFFYTFNPWSKCCYL